MQASITKQSEDTYAIEGELNMQTVPAVSQELEKLFSGLKSTRITFDLASISRSDSAGVALLVDLMQQAKQAELTLSLSHLPSQMKAIAGISGLLEILPITES